MSSTTLAQRAEQLYRQNMDEGYRRTSRMFAVLMFAEWLFGIIVAVVWSPYAWAGRTHTIHTHVWAATLLGGLITGVPIWLALTRPSATITRHAVAVGQILWSAVLIHLTGGRIETHFHIFGSLAFLAFYRDWRVLVPATLVIATDHLLRQLFWPESVYGIANPEWWRFLEHAFWAAFEDVILVFACLRAAEEVKGLAERHVEVERALAELRDSQDALTRAEKLAAVGQLAASVGHELRNPLSAIRNAHAYMGKRIAKDPGPLASDARMKQFGEIVEREIAACAKIIDDLLDFARARPPNLRPCPLGALVDEAMSLVAPRPNVTVRNDIGADIPVPNLDKDQFRQILINLIQNAVEAIPPDHQGVVDVSARGGAGQPWQITVRDNGVGIPTEVAAKIFQPLFTTKTKGTGLGLAVVASVIERHHGKIAVESEPGAGTKFVIELPADEESKAA